MRICSPEGSHIFCVDFATFLQYQHDDESHTSRVGWGLAPLSILARSLGRSGQALRIKTGVSQEGRQRRDAADADARTANYKRHAIYTYKLLLPHTGSTVSNEH